MKTAKQVKSRRAAPRGTRKWSAHVTQTSHAMDLEQGVFAKNDPKKIAASLKRSAEASTHRKTNPYRSALSMITFFINRAGKNLSAKKMAVLEKAKVELKRQFGRS